jgi:hypothetical protein
MKAQHSSSACSRSKELLQASCQQLLDQSLGTAHPCNQPGVTAEMCRCRGWWQGVLAILFLGLALASAEERSFTFNAGLVYDSNGDVSSVVWQLSRLAILSCNLV